LLLINLLKNLHLNLGVSWVTSAATGFLNWTDSAMSSTGQFVTVVSADGHIVFSADYGVTFPQSSSLESIAGQFVSVDVSSDGLYQYAATNNGSFVFVNATGPVRELDVTTAAPVPFPAVWAALTTNGDGSRVYAAVDYSTEVNGPLVFYSYDYAKTWTASTNSCKSHH
jgi:hypothetical protein